MPKRALITGCSGQDGAYLSRLLLDKGYTVFGTVRRISMGATYPRLDSIRDRITLIPADMGDERSLREAVEQSQPDEVYNLASQTLVAVSWSQPAYTSDVNGIGCLRLLEAVRQICPKARYYQASTSEMFGQAKDSPQNELTPLHPRSPYAVAKVYAHHLVSCYRESYGMFACSGILFNHESPLRGAEFVTRKITQAVAAIKRGEQTELRLGNLTPKRDWGYAGDYVWAMWLMLQQDRPQDYVIGTGEQHSVRDFIQYAFGHACLDWRAYIVSDPALIRPAEVDSLLADASKARRELGWEPTVSFNELVRMMVDADLERK